MPKASRRKVSSYTHDASVKVSNRHFAINDNAVEHVEVGGKAEISANDILKALSSEGDTTTNSNATASGTIQKHHLKKKEKQAMKHEALLQKLEASSRSSPYSKSHERRLKRKAKEQVANGLDEIQDALAAVAQDLDVDILAPSAVSGTAGGDDEDMDADSLVADGISKPKAKKKSKAGLIGEGKNNPLSKSQRKRALQAERLRVPMILSNPDYTTNPFQTIRTHAENTLVKHSTTS